HPGRARPLTAPADGGRLLPGSAVWVQEKSAPGGGGARLWDAASGEPVSPPLDHAAPVWVVAFSPDGGTFATGCHDRTARLWLTGPAVQIGPPLKSQGEVGALAFSPDGRTLLTGSLCDRDGGRLWTVPPAQADPRPLYLRRAVVDLLLAADGRTLLTGAHVGAGWRGQFWDLSARQPVGQFADQADP